MKFENHSALISVDALLNEKMIFVREEKVLLDSAAAELFEIDLKQLQQIIRQNRSRFPVEFMLTLTKEEISKLPSATKRKRIYAFKWGGLMMLAGQLKTKRAINIHLQLIRCYSKGVFEIIV